MLNHATSNENQNMKVLLARSKKIEQSEKLKENWKQSLLKWWRK